MSWLKILKYVKVNSLNSLYLVINKENRYFKEINKSKYLTLVPTNESKQKRKKYKELWSKIRDLIKSMTKNLDDYDVRYMKTKVKLDGKLPLNKMIKIYSMVIVNSCCSCFSWK